ncbi:MAG: flagellar hook-basal body complex protein [Clostridia bacterium]|nr:flagellar hook-basal body complex protein [Clostridia bacterium]
MLRAMDSAVAGLRAHQSKLDVIGNNIANVNTFGFKAQTFTFKEAMYQSAVNSTGGVLETAAGTNGAQYGYGTLMGSIITDMTASTPSQVGGLNACLNAQGFFITAAVPDKSTSLTGTDTAELSANIKGAGYEYTRVGQFQLDSKGYLTDGKNFVYGFREKGDASDVDPDNLVALRVPTSAELSIATDGTTTWTLSFDDDEESLLTSSIQINSLGEVTVTIPVEVTKADGTTATEDRQVSIGKVGVATFQNQEGLMKAGGSYYVASTGDNSGACSATVPGGSTSSLMSGYLEASNMDLAKEFSEMITTQRGFQANSKIITVSDEILSELVNMKR